MTTKEISGDRGLPSSKARPGDADPLNPKARLRHVAASHLGGGIAAPLRYAAASAWRDEPLPGQAAATCSWRSGAATRPLVATALMLYLLMSTLLKRMQVA